MKGDPLKTFTASIAALFFSAALLGQPVPSSYTPLSGACVLTDSMVGSAAVWLTARGACNVPPEANAISAAVFVSQALFGGDLRLFDSGLAAAAPVMSFPKVTPASGFATVRLCYPVLECSGVDLGLSTSTPARVIVRVAGYYTPN
jgi:hypothetical protein